MGHNVRSHGLFDRNFFYKLHSISGNWLQQCDFFGAAAQSLLFFTLFFFFFLNSNIENMRPMSVKTVLC
jgi:hypothetical protein